MEDVALWFQQRGLSRREAAVVLGVHWTTVQAWASGRGRGSGAVMGLWEALRMLDAAWGRERTVEFVRGNPPGRWLVAVAVLAASTRSDGGGDGAADSAG